MAGAIITPTSENWGTPFDFFALLEQRYGKFDLDAAAGIDWAMCDNFITKEQDALNPHTAWNGSNVFVNPPYGMWIPLFLERARREIIQATSPKQIVFLIPAKTDTKWFHENCCVYASEINFVKGRLKFRLPEKNNTATFASIVVVYKSWEIPSVQFGRIAKNDRRKATMGKF